MTVEVDSVLEKVVESLAIIEEAGVIVERLFEFCVFLFAVLESVVRVEAGVVVKVVPAFVCWFEMREIEEVEVSDPREFFIVSVL